MKLVAILCILGLFSIAGCKKENKAPANEAPVITVDTIAKDTVLDTAKAIITDTIKEKVAAK